MQVLEKSGGGVDYSFECIGLGPTVQQAVGMLKKGGTAVLVGVVPIGTTVELHAADITLQEKRIMGSMMGSPFFEAGVQKSLGFRMIAEV